MKQQQAQYYFFDTPVSKTKVRNDVYAYRYPNGCININGSKYFLYTVKQAIRLWRDQNPISNKQQSN